MTCSYHIQVYAPSSHSFQSIVSGVTRRFSSMDSTDTSALHPNRCISATFHSHARLSLHLRKSIWRCRCHNARAHDVIVCAARGTMLHRMCRHSGAGVYSAAQEADSSARLSGFGTVRDSVSLAAVPEVRVSTFSSMERPQLDAAVGSQDSQPLEMSESATAAEAPISVTEQGSSLPADQRTDAQPCGSDAAVVQVADRSSRTAVVPSPPSGGALALNTSAGRDRASAAIPAPFCQAAPLARPPAACQRTPSHTAFRGISEEVRGM